MEIAGVDLHWEHLWRLVWGYQGDQWKDQEPQREGWVFVGLWTKVFEGKRKAIEDAEQVQITSASWQWALEASHADG